MSATPAVRTIADSAAPKVNAPPQAVLDNYLRRAKALADEVGEMFGGMAEVQIGIHQADPARYHALPHAPVLYRAGGDRTEVTGAWRRVAGIGPNSGIVVWCYDNSAKRLGHPDLECADVLAARAADALNAAAEAQRALNLHEPCCYEPFGGAS